MLSLLLIIPIRHTHTHKLDCQQNNLQQEIAIYSNEYVNLLELTKSKALTQGFYHLTSNTNRQTHKHILGGNPSVQLPLRQIKEAAEKCPASQPDYSRSDWLDQAKIFDGSSTLTCLRLGSVVDTYLPSGPNSHYLSTESWMRRACLCVRGERRPVGSAWVYLRVCFRKDEW